ncbi:MAG: hypothetical protein AAGD32_17565 [Planctomycetota bacterium]
MSNPASEFELPLDPNRFAEASVRALAECIDRGEFDEGILSSGSVATVLHEAADKLDDLTRERLAFHLALSGVLHHAQDGTNWRTLLTNIVTEIAELRADNEKLRKQLHA